MARQQDLSRFGYRPEAPFQIVRWLERGQVLDRGVNTGIAGYVDGRGCDAFAAQVLSNLQALSSRTFAQKELGRSEAVGHPDVDRINVMGGSLSIGHPFGATGGRLTITILNEMARRDVQFGLITVCAAGGMGFAMVVERR